MKRLLIAHMLMFFSFTVLYPCFSYADDNDSLRSAIMYGNIEEVKIYIENGADVNKAYEDGSTPLLEAIDKSNGSSDIVNLLFQYGANPNLKPAGHSPLSAALKTNNEEIIRLLRPYAQNEGEFYDLALFYRNRNEDPDALEYADRALKLNPSNHDAWAMKGSIYCMQKNMKDSETAYRNALTASVKNLTRNNSADGYTTMVWYAVLSGDFNEALRLGKEGLSLFPESGPLEMNVGHTLLFLGNKKEAMIFYKKAYKKLKQPDQFGDQAAQHYTNDFSYLKERYPDNLSLLEWAEQRLLKPFDFPFNELPFGEERDAVLKLADGADVHKEGLPSIGIVGPVLKKQFGDGLYTVELKTQLSPTVVEKYSLTCDQWGPVERIDLFFTAMPGQDGRRRTLFLVTKLFKEQQGKRDVVFSAMQEDISNELKTQPALPASSTPPPSGPASAKVAVWKLNDATVMLDVANAAASSVKPRIFYVSKKGWEAYLKALHAINKAQ